MTELQAGAIIFISWHFGLIELGAEVLPTTRACVRISDGLFSLGDVLCAPVKHFELHFLGPGF